jgi:hypothetical protein
LRGRQRRSRKCLRESLSDLDARRCTEARCLAPNRTGRSVGVGCRSRLSESAVGCRLSAVGCRLSESESAVGCRSRLSASQRDRGDEFGQKFFERLISEIAEIAGQRREARRWGPIRHRARSSPGIPSPSISGSDAGPAGAPAESDEFPRSYRVLVQRNEPGHGDKGGGAQRDPHQASRKIRKACQMTSAASRARIVFSADAAHHPSAPWLTGDGRCARETSCPPGAVAVRALSRDR